MVGVVTCNSVAVIGETLAAVCAEAYPDVRILVVDNGSTDGTRELVAARFPEVRVVPLHENRGPNPARNRILAEAERGLALILDDDCAPAPGCLRALVRAAQDYPDGAAFGARVVYRSDPGRIQFEGALVHFVGEAVQYLHDVPVEAAPRAVRPVTGLGGGCMLLRPELWREAGGFDEFYFFGREDSELVFRLQLAGHRAYVVPTAKVLHDYVPRGLAAGFYQIRNRWVLMGSLYRLRTLVLLAPALLVHELVIAGFMAASGRLGDYARGTLAAARALPHIRARRRAVAAIRRVPDRAVLAAGPIAVREDLLDTPWKRRLKGALDAFYSGYWRLVGRFV
ncbi:glycosyltransferase family 2 protein [Geminicoccaceae bacterium 1502E]|nr:glycosyltransferase family 2 protein [Geminicoccaceae bacterium 1502E]